MITEQIHRQSVLQDAESRLAHHLKMLEHFNQTKAKELLVKGRTDLVKEATKMQQRLLDLLYRQNIIVTQLIDAKCRDNFSKLNSISELTSFIHHWNHRLVLVPNSRMAVLNLELAKRKLNELVRN